MTWTREEQEFLEAYGFDLMAQVEAMLRHVREYQRALQRFRGTLPPQRSPNPPETPVAAMTEHIRALREAVTQFDSCLSEIQEHTDRHEVAARTPKPFPVRSTKRRRADRSEQ